MNFVKKILWTSCRLCYNSRTLAARKEFFYAPFSEIRCGASFIHAGGLRVSVRVSLCQECLRGAGCLYGAVSGGVLHQRPAAFWVVLRFSPKRLPGSLLDRPGHACNHKFLLSGCTAQTVFSLAPGPVSVGGTVGHTGSGVHPAGDQKAGSAYRLPTDVHCLWVHDLHSRCPSDSCCFAEPCGSGRICSGRYRRRPYGQPRWAGAWSGRPPRPSRPGRGLDRTVP